MAKTILVEMAGTAATYRRTTLNCLRCCLLVAYERLRPPTCCCKLLLRLPHYCIVFTPAMYHLVSLLRTISKQFRSSVMPS